jgi:hypothetical protein
VYEVDIGVAVVELEVDVSGMELVSGLVELLDIGSVDEVVGSISLLIGFVLFDSLHI